MHVRLAGPIVIAALSSTLVLAACSDNGSPDSPTALALASAQSGQSGQDAAAAESRGALVQDASLTPPTPLPQGSDSGDVFRTDQESLEGVTSERVSALATAMGLVGEVAERPGGWLVPAQATRPLEQPRLIVLKDDVGSWFFGTSTDCDLSRPSDSASCTQSSVATAPDLASPVPSDDEGARCPDGAAPRATSDSEGISAAQPLLTALQVPDDADLVADEGPDQTLISVVASPRLNGLATVGIDTRLTLLACGADSVPTEGNGTLVAWTQGNQYPLIDAAAAITRAQTFAQPALELCRPSTQGDGCLTTRQEVVGMEVGLMRDTDLSDGSAIMVPAWLMRTRTEVLEPDGSLAPPDQQSDAISVITVNALPDEFLAPPPTVADQPPPPDDPGGADSSPGSPGVEPGSPGLGDVPVAPPVDPASGVEPEPGPETTQP